MKLGVRGHDLVGTITSPANLSAKLHELKLDTLQLVCHKSIEDVRYVAGDLSEVKVLSIGESFRKMKTDITLIGAYFNPVHPDKEKAAAGVSVFADNLLLAKVLGGGTVGSETGSYNGDKWTYHPQNRTEEALNTVIQTFSDLCERAGEQGVYVGIEGAAGHVCYSVDTLARVKNSIGAKNLRVIFDYYNFMDSDNIDYLQILDKGLQTFDNIHCFHVKDFVTVNGKPKQCPVGKGEADFKKILSVIKQYDPNAALILEGTAGADISSAAEYLREVWSGLYGAD